MAALNFDQLKELNIKEVNQLEKEFPKIQGFLYDSENNTLKRETEEDFAEVLVEEICKK